MFMPTQAPTPKTSARMRAVIPMPLAPLRRLSLTQLFWAGVVLGASANAEAAATGVGIETALLATVRAWLLVGAVDGCGIADGPAAGSGPGFV